MTSLRFLPEQIEHWPIARLKPYERNPRMHSDAQVTKVAASIASYGWTVPLLVTEDGEVIAGHGRLLAAQHLGLTEVPVIRLSHLSAEQARAYRVADNQLVLAGEWNEELLAAELHELNAADFDLDLTGFDQEELDRLLAPLDGDDTGLAGEDVIPEPLVVHPQTGGGYVLLDGHLRLDVLTALGVAEANCLLATADEGYTYNKQINRLSTIQEHNMIRQAIDKGLSPDQIGRALNVNVAWIREKQGLLRGIAAEVVALLKDRELGVAVFSVLRKMKPLRQIEVAELMIAANRLTVSYAKALLAATPKEQLAEPEKPKSISGVSAEAIARMEQEMDHLQRDYRLVEDGYGTTMLNLVVAKGYVGRLLANDEVARYLERNHLDMKRELEGIIAAIRTDASVEERFHPPLASLASAAALPLGRR